MSAYHEIAIGPCGGHIPDGDVIDVRFVVDELTAIFAGDSGGGARGNDEITFNTTWLRDNCPCHECRILQTDERRWQPWRDRDPPQVLAAAVLDGALHVEWASGHTSVFTAQTFAAIDLASHRGGSSVRVWTAGYEIERFGHDDAAADTGTRRRLFEAFRRDGAIVVTAAPTMPGSVIDFVRTLGLTVRDSSLGLIFDVTLDPAGYNIAYTAEAVPPHNDNAQSTHPPSGQVLAMLVNDASGGESVIVDSLAVLEQLEAIDPTAIDVLARVAVGHRQYSATAEGFTRAPLVVRDREGRYTHLRFSNQLMQPLPFDDPDVAEWYRAYRMLGAIVTDSANHVGFRLAAGEMLFVNNHRILHSRTAFRPDGARHLQDIYFDADDVFGSLARMTGEATDSMVTR